MQEVKLSLKFPASLEHAAEHATVCVEAVKAGDDVDLDYSPQSLEYLDSVIMDWHEQNATVEDVGSALFSVGCYLGEVMLRNIGGKWIPLEGSGMDQVASFPMLVQLDNGLICNPIDKVFKRLQGDDEDYLPDFYRVLLAEGSNQVSLDEDKDSLYPVLRNFEPNDQFVETIVNVPIAENLAIFAGRKIVGPSGSRAIDYVLKSDLDEYDLSENEIFDYCFENFFAAKIQVQRFEQNGDQLLELASSEGLVSAIIGHHSSFARFVSMLKTDEIALAIPDPHSLLATPIGSSFEAGFHDIISKVEQDPGAMHLEPAVFHWKENGKLRRVSLSDNK